MARSTQGPKKPLICGLRRPLESISTRPSGMAIVAAVAHSTVLGAAASTAATLSAPTRCSWSRPHGPHKRPTRPVLPRPLLLRPLLPWPLLGSYMPKVAELQLSRSATESWARVSWER